MRVVAIGDAHLGRSYFPYTTPEGVNQREHDFEVSFAAAVELALAQEPDAVMWLGDVFDHPRPTYRSYRVAQRALAQIRAHGVPCVVISGNHDTPRLPGMGSPYSALADAFPEVHFAHRLAYERFELPGLVVHAVPQMLTVEHTLEALAEADQNRSLDRTNLLLTHPRVPQVQPKYADINEIEVDAGMLRADLVLLGHYHSFRRVMPGIWYAGATDTFSFADETDDKGVALLNTDTGTCEHVVLEGRRPMVYLDRIEALGMSASEVESLLVRAVTGLPDGAVARIEIDGAAPDVWRMVDLDRVREASRPALHVKYEARFARVAGHADLPQLTEMTARWHGYIAEQDLLGYNRDRLAKLGEEYMNRAIEEAG